MTDIRVSFIRGICVLLLIASFCPDASAQAGRGNLFMSGIVWNEDGSPQVGTRVVAVFGERTDTVFTSPIPLSSCLLDRSRIFRETTTDEEGKWTLRFLKKGKWIVSAFSDERMSEMMEILLNVNRTNVDLILTETAAEFLVEAKSAIYDEDYEKAIQILSWFISYFPNSRELESALFWISHSYDRLSQDKIWMAFSFSSIP